jgi:hypothetical protein
VTWRLAIALVAIAAVTLTWFHTSDLGPSFAAGVPAPAPYQAMPATPHFSARITYTGRWERIAHGGHLPGGVSARSFRAGDALTLVYRGKRVRLFGVVGPGGGSGVVVVPGRPPANVDFYRARRLHGRLMYAGPVQDMGIHSLSIVVAPVHRHGRVHGYVNIEAFDVDGVPG